MSHDTYLNGMTASFDTIPCFRFNYFLTHSYKTKQWTNDNIRSGWLSAKSFKEVYIAEQGKWTPAKEVPDSSLPISNHIGWLLYFVGIPNLVLRNDGTPSSVYVNLTYSLPSPGVLSLCWLCFRDIARCNYNTLSQRIDLFRHQAILIGSHT